MNRLLPGGKFGTQPDGKGECSSIGQIEDPFSKPQEDLVQADGNGSATPLHIMVILGNNNIPKGFHRLVGGKLQQVGVVIGD